VPFPRATRTPLKPVRPPTLTGFSFFMKSPAFQFYPSDYLGSARVAEMTLEEEGAYLRALLYCWNHGSLPNDVERLSRIIGKGCSTSVATTVQRMFNENPNDSTKLVHDRLNQERQKQEQHRIQRSEAGKRSAEIRANGNERTNVRSTSVDISLQRESNSSSSSSSSSTIREIHSHSHNAGANGPVHDYPKNVQEVIDLAATVGHTPEVATAYYDKRKATGFCKQQGTAMVFITDWQADFRHMARYIASDLQKLKTTATGPRYMSKQDEIDEINRKFNEKIKAQRIIENQMKAQQHES